MAVHSAFPCTWAALGSNSRSPVDSHRDYGESLACGAHESWVALCSSSGVAGSWSMSCVIGVNLS